MPLSTRTGRSVWDMDVPGATMNLSMKVDRGTAIGAIPALTLRVEGAVTEPMQAFYISPGRPWLTVDVTGTVHPQSTLRSITLR